MNLKLSMSSIEPAHTAQRVEWLLRELISVILALSISYSLPLLVPSLNFIAKAELAPYPQDVNADDPLAYWRLNGHDKGAILNDEDGSITLKRGDQRALEGADIGGQEVAFELWIKDGQGTALRYADSKGQEAFAIENTKTLIIRLFGERHDTEITLKRGEWQHLGVSWRSSDGLLTVCVNGFLKKSIKTNKGRQLPFDGQLIIGGEFSGGLDELAIFDKTRHASHWLHRYRVAHALSAPSTPNEDLPVKLVVQSGHPEVIRSMSWHPDGSKFATLSDSDEEIIRIWDSQSGIVLHTLAGHIGGVRSLSWNPDGTQIAVTCTGEKNPSGAIKIWDSQTGNLIHTLKLPDHYFKVVSWSPDGNRLATGDSNGTVKIWDGQTGTLIHNLKSHTGDVNVMSWSPNGRKLATGSGDHTAKIWDTQSGTLLHTLIGHSEVHAVGIVYHTECVKSLSWSPSGDRLAIASKKRARIWDSQTGTLLYDLEGHNSTVDIVSWNHDGSRLATSGQYTSKIWDGQTGTLINSLKGGAVSWSPDGGKLATTDASIWTTKVRTMVWDGRAHVLLQAFRGIFKSWSPDGNKIVTTQGVTRIWEDQTRSLLQSLKNAVHFAYSVSWSPDGSRLATVGTYSVNIWDWQKGNLLHNLTGHTSTITSISWSSDGSRLATSSEDDTVKIWDSHNGVLLYTLEFEYLSQLFSVAWSPDGRLLAITGYKVAWVWDTQTGNLHHTFKGHQNFVNLVSWSPDGSLLATGSWDGTAKVWDCQNGDLLHTLKGDIDGITSVEWSPDGQLLAISSLVLTNNKQITKVWDGKTGTLLHTLRGDTASWSPDGNLLATGGDHDGTAHIWSRRMGDLLYSLKGHTNAITSVTWSSDGRLLATDSWDDTIKIWDGKTGALIHTLEGTLHIFSDRSRHAPVIWNPKSQVLAISSDDGIARIWNIQQDSQVMMIGAHEGQWLTINTDGYFDGSNNADDLLAIVQGDQAFTFDQIAPTRNRPDKVIETLGGSKSLIAFNKLLWMRRLKSLGLTPEEVSEDFSSSPKVRIIQTSESDEDGLVKLLVLFADKVGLKGYRIFVNGVPLSQGLTSLTGTRKRLMIEVPLTQGSNKIELSAFNIRGVESLRTTTTIEHDGEGLPAPKLYFLGFGVSDYADDQLDLQFAHQDALDLQRALSTSRGDFIEVKSQVFINAQVNETALQEAHKFLSQVTEHDTLVMFVAGHGLRGDDAAHTYYYLDHDTDLDNLEKTAIVFEEMEALLYNSRARKKLFLLDTCESGEDIDLEKLTADIQGVTSLKARSVRGAKRITASALQTNEESDVEEERMTQMWLQMLRDRNRLIMLDLARRSGAVVLASSLGRESSLETESWANGAFTEEILRALQSDVADSDRDGNVSVAELTRYVTQAVPKLTGGRQHPNIERDNPQQHFALPISKAKKK